MRKVLSLVLFGSIAPHYSTKVLFTMVTARRMELPTLVQTLREPPSSPANSQQAYKYAVQTAIRNKMKRRFHFLQRAR